MQHEYTQPENVSDEAVEAAGKMSEAIELVERARGRLYDFHQMIGEADFKLEEAANMLEKAGFTAQAKALRTEIIGRNVLHGRWTFQIIDEFDDLYYAPLKEAGKKVQQETVEGRRHLYEAKLKEQRRTKNEPGHEGRP